VTLLREEALPRIGMPIAREFTGAAGEFTFDGVAPGVYAAFVQADGYAVWSQRHVVLSAEHAAEIEVALVPGGTIHGQVIDAATQLPVAGALVVSETDAPGQLLPEVGDGIPEGFTAAAITLPNGSFTIEHLSPGLQVLRATAPGHAPAWSKAMVEPGGDRAGVM